MGIQQDDEVPDSFDEAFADNYLGNPDTVAALVGDFCASVECQFIDLMNGLVEKAVFDKSLNDQIHKIADIFSGRDPDYLTIKGYNEHTLGYKLMADLGEFWRNRRSKWNDDPVCVLFEWIAALVAEKTKLADGDDMLLEIMLKPSIQYTTSVLLGIEERM